MAERRFTAPSPPKRFQPSPIRLADVPNRPLEDWIPDAFGHTQQVPVVQTQRLSGTVGSISNTEDNPRVMGAYTRKSPAAPDGPYIQLRPNSANHFDKSPAQTAGHEAGHAIWGTDISDQAKQAWTQLHATHVVQSAQSTAARPSFIKQYPDDPSHSFAEAYGYYVSDPQRLQKESPQAYGFIRDLAGFEYARPRNPAR